MNAPLITWCCIVALLATIVLIRLINSLSAHARHHHRFIEIGSEREEFYLPGDPDPEVTDNNYFEDADDL